MEKEKVKRTINEAASNPEYEMTIGAQIAIARRSRGITQETLAALVGSTRTSINNMENNRRYPSIKSLMKMCDVLGYQMMIIPQFNHKLKIKKEDEQRSSEYSGITREFEIPAGGEPGVSGGDEKVSNDTGTV